MSNNQSLQIKSLYCLIVPVDFIFSMTNTFSEISQNQLDDFFYHKADVFFANHAHTALTYDDISLATQYSTLLPKETLIETRISDQVVLPVPIISSDMDTVTEANMAIAMALSGGLGLIHYNMSLTEQIRQVSKVKHFIHGLIQDPITVSPDDLIGDILQLIQNKNYNFDTFPVVDKKNKLLGLLPGHALRTRYINKNVDAVMIPKKQIASLLEDTLGNDPIQAADEFFQNNWNHNKLLIVNKEGQLKGLFVRSDIERILEESSTHLRPCRDETFRLTCGAAIAIPRTKTGEIDDTTLLNHIQALVDTGLNVAALSSAHAHTKSMGNAVQLIRTAFPNLTLIAGNVTSAEGVEFLIRSGANAIKIGQGPGSICTTRVVAGVGVPQLTALYLAKKAAENHGTCIIADGGINKSGDIVKALTLADTVICGGLLAGCPEAPGRIIEIEGKRYKEYRGMGSLTAMQSGSAARYGHKQTDILKKTAAEGIEALKELSEPVAIVLNTLIGGLQSGMGYLGAATLKELKTKARYIRISSSGLKEAYPHDVVQIKRSL